MLLAMNRTESLGTRLLSRHIWNDKTLGRGHFWNRDLGLGADDWASLNGKCACGMNNSCVNPCFGCNCDANDYESAWGQRSPHWQNKASSDTARAWWCRERQPRISGSWKTELLRHSMKAKLFESVKINHVVVNFIYKRFVCLIHFYGR